MPLRWIIIHNRNLLPRCCDADRVRTWPLMDWDFSFSSKLHRYDQTNENSINGHVVVQNTVKVFFHNLLLSSKKTIAKTYVLYCPIHRSIWCCCIKSCNAVLAQHNRFVGSKQSTRPNIPVQWGLMNGLFRVGHAQTEFVWKTH